MRELSLEEIKSISLDILQDVHDFCIRNQIRYSLSSGTLLGAIRHKGFIPWDDDIDILMPRPDYERFCKIYKSMNKYRLFCAQYDNHWSAFSIVCDMEKTLVIRRWPMGSKPTGIWIDVMPIDGAEIDDVLFRTHAEEAMSLYRDLIERRKIKKSLYSRGLRNKLGYIKQTILGNCSVHKHTMEYVNCCKRIPYGSTPYVSNFTGCAKLLPRRHNLEAFTDFVTAKFEDREFQIIKGYDHYLRNVYGNDYMQLPPAEKRYSHSVHKYYFK